MGGKDLYEGLQQSAQMFVDYSIKRWATNGLSFRALWFGLAVLAEGHMAKLLCSQRAGDVGNR